MLAIVSPKDWFGGTALAFNEMSAALVAPLIGVGGVIVCVVVAQRVMSAVIDQSGPLGASPPFAGERATLSETGGRAVRTKRQPCF